LALPRLRCVTKAGELGRGGRDAIGRDDEVTASDEWRVPPPLAARLAADPVDAEWLRGLPSRAAGLAERWTLRADGEAWSGFNSAVWPVRDGEDRPLVLKMSRPGWSIEPEVVALRAWDHGAVGCHDHSASDNAALLQRLDANRSLDTVADIEDACRAAASVLAALHRVGPPPGFRHLDMEAQSLADEIRHRSRGPLPSCLTRRQVDQAVDTWQAVEPAVTDRLLHNDAHFLNVLATLQAEPRWRAIDPYPFVGPVEMELVPVLRNRWADAAATGDPDRALRRRVDLMSEIIGGSPPRARAFAQAAAVVNLLSLLPEEPDHFFVPPYTVIAGWS